jgi:hypothetical protein
MIPSPPSRATSIKYVHLKELPPGTTLSRVKSVYSGSWLAAKSLGDSDNGRNREEEGEEEFGGVSVEVDDDDSRSIRTIVPHELERPKRRTRSRWRSRKKRSMRSAG